jgi:hypothetical protein
LALPLVCVLATSGCAADFPPVAVGWDAAPLVAWKLCDPDLGVADVTVARVTDSSDPSAWPVVWRAESTSDDTARSSIAVVAEVPGYTVSTGDAWPLQEDVRYAVTDAEDERGRNKLAVVLEFRVADLRTGAVVADPETEQDLATWLGSAGPDCGH